MNTQILGLRTAIYKVNNIKEAKEWYSKVFQTTPYFDEPYYVGFNIWGYELGIQAEETPKGENIAVFWGVNDIQSSYQHFIDCWAKEEEKPMNVGGEIMVATIKDPWNNLIGLIYNPEYKNKN